VSLPALNPFGEGARLHHVGVAVRSIQESAPGLAEVEDPVQKVAVGFLEMHGTVLELIEPRGDDSPVRRSLDAGERLVHLCYEVDNLEASMAEARSRGFHTLRSPVPAPAFDGRRIAWLFHRVFGLFELVER